MHHHHIPPEMPLKHVLPIHTNSITQALHTVHTGHVSTTFSVSIYCVCAGLTSHRAQHCAHRAVSTLPGTRGTRWWKTAAFSHSASTANYYNRYPGNTPENHSPTKGCMMNSKQHWGAEFRTLGPVASIRLKQNPWCTSMGCRVQNSGTWDPWLPVVETADFSHSACTAHGAPPISPRRLEYPLSHPASSSDVPHCLALAGEVVVTGVVVAAPGILLGQLDQ